MLAGVGAGICARVGAGVMADTGPGVGAGVGAVVGAVVGASACAHWSAGQLTSALRSGGGAAVGIQSQWGCYVTHPSFAIAV